MEETKTKVCCHCKQEKPLTEFTMNKNEADGHARTCRECTNQMNRASRLKRKMRAKEESAAISKIKEDSPLSAYTPRELMDELGRRGYRGNLSYTFTAKVGIPE